jgi:hypothetical protein
VGAPVKVGNHEVRQKVAVALTSCICGRYYRMTDKSALADFFRAEPTGVDLPYASGRKTHPTDARAYCRRKINAIASSWVFLDDGGSAKMLTSPIDHNLERLSQSP